MRADEKEFYIKQVLSSELSNLLEFIAVQQKRIADAHVKKADAEEKKAETQKLIADSLNNILEILLKQTTASGIDIPDTIVDVPDIPAMDNPVEPDAQPDTVPETEEPETVTAEIEPAETEFAEEERGLQETEGQHDDPEPEHMEAEPAADDGGAEPMETETIEMDVNEDVFTEDTTESDLKETGAEDAELDIDNLLEEVNPASDDASQEIKIDAVSEETIAEDVKTEADVVELDEPYETGEASDPANEITSAEDIETAQSQPPKTLPNDYKSKIISRIITLKEKKGFSIDATVSYLNEKGYKPISNEDVWNRDMISKIFSHINTVRTRRAG